MPQHDVRFTIPERSLGKTDVEFSIIRDGAFFGTMKISKGAIVWEPAHAKKYQYQLSWTVFDAIAQERGRRVTR